MKLILTEKPSVAQDFANALHCNKKEGYFENDKYIITFCVGHLLELFSPDNYSENFKKWTIESLPIIPNNFKYKPIQNTKKQFNTIKHIIKSNTFDKIILATDAGREGELIGRLVLLYANAKNETFRFWSSEALTEEVINRELSNIKPINNYDSLYKEGQCRQFSDWLIGMNLSRFYTIKLGELFSFGRVQVAVLGLICQRENEILNFKPKTYYQGEGIFKKDNVLFKGLYTVKNENKFDKKLDLAFIECLKKSSGIVSEITNKEVSKPPNLLFNLTNLQSTVNKIYGFSAKKTLTICQKLYEEYKCLSYPRTPSRVLGESNVELVKTKIKLLKNVYPQYANKINMSLVDNKNKRVFNDAKLEDHHALIPLNKLPVEASDDEKKIFELVIISFFASFHDNYIFNSLTVNIDVESYNFIAKGKADIQLGWKELYNDGKEESAKMEKLPVLSHSDIVNVEDIKIVDKQTKPPVRFSEGSLLLAMENPKKYLSEGTEYNFDNNCGIGTQATRANIIEILLNREYIKRSKKLLIPDVKGNFFYESLLKDELITRFVKVDETAKWETLLRENPKNFFSAITDFINTAIAQLKNSQISKYEKARDMIGKCPVCNANVYEGKKTYYCENLTKDKCRFMIYKLMLSKKLSVGTVKQLLAHKQSKQMEFVSTKSKKCFSARLKLNEKGKIDFVFNK